MSANRNTIQRALIVSAVRSLPHPTADEVYSAVAEKHPNISRGTVYRNLNRLVESGELRKVQVPEAADRFDFTLKNHYHIRCVRCGRVFDVRMDYIDRIEDKILDKQGFTILSHDIVFEGICPECNKQRNDLEV